MGRNRHPLLASSTNMIYVYLDLAKVRDSGPSGARHQTGTMQFMAIEVLRGVDQPTVMTLSHSSMFCSGCVHAVLGPIGLVVGKCRPERVFCENGRLEVSRILHELKSMGVRGIKEVMDEFPETLNLVKPLCVKIRKILFPLDEDEGISILTPIGSPDQLYNAIVAAYEESIHILSKDY